MRRLRNALIVGSAAVVLTVPGGTATGAIAHDVAVRAPDPAASRDAPDPAVERAKAIVAKMTLDEKISQLHGIRDDARDLYRIIPGIPRLGIPDFLATNGPAGVSTGGSRKPENQPLATALPAPVALAATFDLDAAERYGTIAGKETLHVGRNFLQGPTVEIHRTPYGGRNFESYGEDPFLAGKIAARNIIGTQAQGVPANVKHYIANNQEIDRFSVNELIDERTMREIYLAPYEWAVKEGHVASAMCSYPKINGVHACENAGVLGVARNDWAWDGFFTPDYGAVHSTVASAKAGLDLEFPTGKFFGDALKKAVQDGQVPMALVDEKLVRRYAKMIEFGMFDRTPSTTPIPAQEHGAQSRNIAEQGMVLLKNAPSGTAPVLPLDATALKSIALIGPYAGNAVTGGGGSSHVKPLYTVKPLDGLRKRAGSGVTVTFADGKDITKAAAAAKAADIAVVMVGEISGEGDSHERTTIALAGNQDALVSAVAAANRRTVVVLKSGGPVLMPWLANVPAVLAAWYPGEEDGNAVARVLFGDVNPSGKLPMTFPRREADLPTKTVEQYPGVLGPDGHRTATFSEGVFVGYRHYDRNRVEPLFPFGHGLSYTQFEYSDLRITQGAGGAVNVRVTVKNIGQRAGKEAVQLYVGAPAAAPVPIPLQQLQGFAKLEMRAQQTKRVSFSLPQRAFSYWDVRSHGWKVAGGAYPILVGSSSRDIRLRGSVQVAGSSATADAALVAATTTVFVSPDGNDGNPGTATQPVRTLNRARDLVRTMNQNMTGDIVVQLAAGTYRLTSPLRLDARDSGSGGHNVIWQGAPGARPVVSGGVPVTGWRRTDAGRDIWSAPAPAGLTNTRQLYVDGIRAQRARGYPPSALTATATGYTAASDAMSRWRNPGDVEMVYTGGDTLWSARSYGLGGWTEPRCPVGAISGTTVTMAQPCWDNSTKRPVDPNHVTRSLHEVGRPDLHSNRQPAYLENAFELLDQPGEWYLDRTAKTVHYIPRPGQDMSRVQVEAPRLEALVQGWGSATAPLRNVRFRGLQFAYATWLRPSTGEGLSEIQATYSITGANGYRTQGLCRQFSGGTCPFGAWTKTPGNVSFRYAHDIGLFDDDFAHLGGAGLDFDDGVQDAVVSGSVFTDISGTGVHVGDVDKPAATGPDVTSDIDIRNNHLYQLPVEFHGGTAIFNGYTQRTAIMNNQIDHTAYSGISNCWGGWLDKVAQPGQPNLSRDNRIARNLVFEHMMWLSDGAGIYNNGVAGPSLANGLAITGNVIRDQRGPGHGIYLDNGSYGITVAGNVLAGNPHDWGSLRKDHSAGGGTQSPMDISGNFWQQGDTPDRTAPAATIRGNRIIARLSDAPAAVVAAAGLEADHRDILARRFAAPTVPNPPERVAAFAGDRFAYVSWLVPMLDGGQAITSYTVTASTGQRVTVPVADFARLGYVIVPGLANGASTRFTVTANSAAGTGLASLPSAPVTPKAGTVTAPGAPEALLVRAGNGVASIQFSPPAAEGGSPVVAYRITVVGGATRTVAGRLVILKKKNVPYVIDGLTNGRSTVIEVAAVNAAGTGPAVRATVTPSA